VESLPFRGNLVSLLFVQITSFPPLVIITRSKADYGLIDYMGRLLLWGDLVAITQQNIRSSVSQKT